MSSKHNRRKRKAHAPATTAVTYDVPLLVERVQQVNSSGGLTYEEANWARLSPTFRAAHNRLRQARGQATIPPPKVDLWVPPKAPLIKPFDANDPEFIKATREFVGAPMMMGGGRGEEGFTVNGQRVNDAGLLAGLKKVE
jgi:hypothetical protein